MNYDLLLQIRLSEFDGNPPGNNKCNYWSIWSEKNHWLGGFAVPPRRAEGWGGFKTDYGDTVLSPKPKTPSNSRFYGYHLKGTRG